MHDKQLPPGHSLACSRDTGGSQRVQDQKLIKEGGAHWSQNARSSLHSPLFPQYLFRHRFLIFPSFFSPSSPIPLLPLLFPFHLILLLLLFLLVHFLSPFFASQSYSKTVQVSPRKKLHCSSLQLWTNHYSLGSNHVWSRRQRKQALLPGYI